MDGFDPRRNRRGPGSAGRRAGAAPGAGAGRDAERQSAAPAEQVSRQAGRAGVPLDHLLALPALLGHRRDDVPEFGPRGFQPIGAAINDNAQALVPEFIRKFGLTYPVGVTPLAMAYDFLGLNIIEPSPMPQLVFIDRKGIVRAQYAGDDDFFKEAEETNMRKQIEALLKDTGPTKSRSEEHTS